MSSRPTTPTRKSSKRAAPQGESAGIADVRDVVEFIKSNAQAYAGEKP